MRGGGVNGLAMMFIGDVGVIKNKEDKFVVIMDGKIYGKFNMRQMEKIEEMLEK